MATVLYTSTERIRAVLGVTVEEIEDAQIIDLGVDELLEQRLLTVYPDHAALKVAIDASTATAEEEADWLALKIYCRYEAACLFLPQLVTLLAQKISDGDAEMQRYNDTNLEVTRAEIRAARDQALADLNPELVIDLTDAAGSIFSMVPPSYNPVTNV